MIGWLEFSPSKKGRLLQNRKNTSMKFKSSFVVISQVSDVTHGSLVLYTCGTLNLFFGQILGKPWWFFFKYLKGIPFVWGLLLKSSISVGRPYSDCFVYSYYSFFHHILSSRFLRDDWMDFLEIFRVYLLDYDLNTFFLHFFDFHFRSRNLADFRSCPLMFSKTVDDKDLNFQRW